MNEERIECDSFLHVQKSSPCGHCLRQGIFLRSEESAWFTHHGHPLQLCAVLDGAHEVGNLAHQVGQAQAHEDGRDSSANETFPGLLGTQLYQRSSAHKKAKHVGHDIVDDNHHDRHDEPDETLEHVLNDQIGLTDNTE